MKGSENRMTIFMEGANNRFVIPVYQRRYDWKYENCRQLYEDLKKVINEGRNSHFFGSIVSAVVPDGSRMEYHIIDGQQRLTTITLLLLAICNLIKTDKVDCDDPHLDEQIMESYLISKWAKEDDRIKLIPVKKDREALKRLFTDEEDYDKSSNLTINYQYFYDVILKDNISVSKLYHAIEKLEIISITLDQDDNAQLIFESLNSTGLALSEGDKIRNYILMGLPTKSQTKYYDAYWSKIEQNTQNNVSDFIRDYLSVKQQSTPNMNDVYKTFKVYAQSCDLNVDELLEDILKYSRYYNKFLTAKSNLGCCQLDDCLYRLNRLEIAVVRPFLMEVFKLQQDDKISIQDTLSVLLIVENYLFRRNICEVPTNALNKVFVHLNKEILRYDNTSNDYVEKLIYALTSKRDFGRFPDDEEFKQALSTKEIYKMRGKYKAYLFERFENFGTKETKDVFDHLDKNTYTIEHIMPQTLSPSWIESLGEQADEIHETWLHRLANLTLTGYNSNLSNNSFIEKRDGVGGYRDSGLRMNQKIAQLESWGLSELEERNQEMINRAILIWQYPKTDFVPAEKEYDSCTLDDENYDLTGREIIKYSYMNIEQSVTSWVEMMERIIKYLHEKDKSVLSSIVFDSFDTTWNYISSDETKFKMPLKIDEHIYIQKNTSTLTKVTLLRKLFNLYKADPMDLVFYLKDVKSYVPSGVRFETRKKYWTYALPILRKKTMHRGTFNAVTPNISNTMTGAFGVGGIGINCIANMDGARVEFFISTSDKEKNKSIYDKIFSHKVEIENKLGVALNWNRADEYKISYISYVLENVSINNESDWPVMAEFHAKWSDKFGETFIEYFMDKKDIRYSDIAGIFREWALTKENIYLDIKRSVRSYTRFTTKGMNEILPEILDSPSGWNSNNHYFYEIANHENQPSYIKLVLSNKNSSEEFKQICKKIDKIYPSGNKKEDWQWRQIYKSKIIEIGDNPNKEELFEFLDSCMEEILLFEKDLKNKLNETI